MIKEYEEIEKTFDERERFIDSQKDEKIYGWLCAKHLVWIGNDHRNCPLCILEEKNKVVYQAEVETVDDEEIKKKKEKDKERKRLAMLDPEKRKRHNENVARYYERERARKKEHGLII